MYGFKYTYVLFLLVKDLFYFFLPGKCVIFISPNKTFTLGCKMSIKYMYLFNWLSSFYMCLGFLSTFFFAGKLEKISFFYDKLL